MIATLFISGEVLVRYLVRNDTDIQQLNGISIPPLSPPLAQIEEAIDRYERRINESPFIYDETLGWTNQPLYEDAAVGIRVNADGIRANQDFGQLPATDTLRIALFGDSFTYSPGVANEESLDYALQAALQAMGIRAEVMNFGVPAYGIDQSYLRWLNDGINYQPDITILSFSTRMSGRSLNIFRVISSPQTSLPFSKPRFYVKDDQLQLVNSPTIPLDKVLSTLENFATDPLHEYEFYYDDRYIESWWHQSRFLAYATESIRNTIVNIIGDDSTEVTHINRVIVTAFDESSHDNNAIFMLGHLPTQKNLSNDEGNFQYYDLLLSFRDQYLLLDASPVLADVRQHDGWLDDGHYNTIGNQIVAQHFAAQITDCLNNERCLPPRFASEQRFRIN